MDQLRRELWQRICSNTGPDLFDKQTFVADEKLRLANGREDPLRAQLINFDGLMARGMSADQSQLAWRTIESLSQQGDQRFICCRVNGWSRDFDPQLISHRFTDFIPRGAGLELNRQQHTVRLSGDENGQSQGWFVGRLTRGCFPAVHFDDYFARMPNAHERKSFLIPVVADSDAGLDRL